MATRRVRDAVIVGALLIAGSAYFLIGRRTPEQRILEQLQLLGRHVEQTPTARATIDKALAPFVEQDVRIHIPEFGALVGRQQAAALLSETKLLYPSVSLRFEHVQVALDRDQAGATVQADASLRLERAGRVDTDERRVTLRMQRSGANDWRVAAADVAAKSNEQPEARP